MVGSAVCIEFDQLFVDRNFDKGRFEIDQNPLHLDNLIQLDAGRQAFSKRPALDLGGIGSGAFEEAVGARNCWARQVSVPPRNKVPAASKVITGGDRLWVVMESILARMRYGQRKIP